ncbi:MAG: DUF4258 domain-containing protein [Bacteroidota bacterium]|nr:DUF4258 domain-containing protein [Bacteroidota bacterium]
MKRRSSFYFLVIIIVVLLIIKSSAWFNQLNRDTSSFRNTGHLILTKHVKCRMDCRHITEDEIKEILKEGSVNYAKSGIGSKGDSTFALEGYSHENQHIRVVVAPESDGLVVITCIDLGHEWPCNCY